MRAVPAAVIVPPKTGFHIDDIVLTETTVSLHWRNAPPGPVCAEGAPSPAGPWTFIDESETDFLSFPRQGDIAFFRLVSIQANTPGQTLWVDTPATTVNDFVRSLARHPNGDVVASGDLNNTLFIRKYSPDGQQQWTKNFSGTAYGYATAFDAEGNIYVAGKFAVSIDLGGGPITGTSGIQGDVFVVKYAAGGGYQWAKSFSSGGGCGALCISVQGSSIYLGGSLGGSIDFGCATVTSGAWLAKLDAANGACIWAKGFGNSGANTVEGVSASQADVWITGTFTGAANFGGGAVNSKGGSFDGYIAQFTPAGAHLTSSTFGDLWMDAGHSIAHADDSDVVFGGDFRGTVTFGSDVFVTQGVNPIDGVLARVNNGGGYLWAKQIAGAAGNFDSVRGVAAEGETIIAGGDVLGGFDFGCGIGTGQGGKDAFIAKLDHNGDCIWSRVFGGFSIDSTLAVCPGVAGGGNWFGTVDFGTGPKTSIGGGDGFVIGMEP